MNLIDINIIQKNQKHTESENDLESESVSVQK